MKNSQIHYPIIVLLLFLTASKLYAQQDHLIDSRSPMIKKYKIEERKEGWLYVHSRMTVKQAIDDIIKDKSSFGLNSDDKLFELSGQDAKSFINKNPQLSAKGVLKINQYHNGIKVEAAQLSIHYDSAGNVRLINGKLAKNITSNLPKVEEHEALEQALLKINAEKYAWESPEWEQQLKNDLEDENATFYPKAELLYARVKPIDDFRSSNYKLVYRFEITSINPKYAQDEVLIDAQTAEVIRSQSMVRDSWGTVNTMYNGTRGFNTQWRGFPNYDYVLKDQTNGDKLHTLRWSSSTPWWQRPEIDDNDNVWSEPAATTHWAIQMAWGYYSSSFYRNGMDNMGGKVRIEAESSEIGVAGYYRTGGYDYLVFGRSSPSAVNGNLATLDIAGHEFTHGVTANEANLIYQGESGALNESFSDIFGVMVERYIEGGVNWTMGEDAGFTVRSLENPNIFGHPDTYQGTNWIDPSSPFDNGGVHINSGVQNHWFFLLANGGSGTNDFGQAFNVNGIGIVNAAKIAYRNLSIYLQQGSTFADAREGSINAARDLFGECSLQLAATMDAWHAVGIGALSGLCVSTLYPSSVQFCIEDGIFNANFSFTYSPQSAIVTWYAPKYWVFSSYGSVLSLENINNPQVSTQTLNVSINSNGQTIWKTAYVNIIECYGGCPPGDPCDQLRKRTIDTTEKAIEEKSEETNFSTEFNISPNPVSEALNIAVMLPKNEESYVTIVDLAGRIIIDKTITENGILRLEVGALKPGVYIVVVNSGTSSWSERIFIDR